ncbi:hypothetical protein [Sorangium sp. So ce1153]|uniref:hypothetical protein n=1 Tax=Sorangium sp. So ce1153 TaxID=3133333 RepID=UPI003F61535E
MPRMRRRDLLRIFAPGPGAPRGSTAAPAAPSSTAPAVSFSLEAFYAQREGSGAAAGQTIPTFDVTARAELPAPRAGAGCGLCVEVCPAPVNGFSVVQRALPGGATRHG